MATMCFDFYLVLPQLIALLIMMVWLWSSFREIHLLIAGARTTGKIVSVTDNPDTDTQLNKIALIEISYHGKEAVIRHFFSTSTDDITPDVVICINKRRLDRSIVKPDMRAFIFPHIIVPSLFILGICIAIYNSQTCQG